MELTKELRAQLQQVHSRVIQKMKRQAEEILKSIREEITTHASVEQDKMSKMLAEQKAKLEKDFQKEKEMLLKKTVEETERRLAEEYSVYIKQHEAEWKKNFEKQIRAEIESTIKEQCWAQYQKEMEALKADNQKQLEALKQKYEEEVQKAKLREQITRQEFQSAVTVPKLEESLGVKKEHRDVHNRGKQLKHDFLCSDIVDQRLKLPINTQMIQQPQQMMSDLSNSIVRLFPFLLMLYSWRWSLRKRVHVRLHQN